MYPMTAHHILTPGQLLANVPGSLGFYPTESLILMGFNATAEEGENQTQTDNRATGNPVNVTLGPTLRIDIDDFENLQGDIVRALAPLEPTVVFAFIISQRPERLLDEVTHKLYNSGTTHGMTIDACWYTPEIKTGEPYELWFGRDLTPGATSGNTWQYGTIPSITATPSMEEFVDRGELPELNRKEAVRPYITRNNAFSSQEAARLAATARTLSTALADGERFGSAANPYGIEDIAQDARLLLEEYSAHDAWDSNDHLLLTVATWLATTATRDLVLAEFLAQPAAGASVLLEVAQTFSGEIRANALSIYAAAQVVLRQSHRAGLALTCVLQEYPEHRLSSLFYKLYSAGQLHNIVDCATEGSHAAQEMILGDIERKRSVLGSAAVKEGETGTLGAGENRDGRSGANAA